MRTIVFIFFFFIITMPLLHAQDSIRSKKSISLNQGFTYMVTKDLYRSPYVYRGINPFVALNFSINSRNAIHQIHSTYTFGEIKTSFSPLAPVHLLTFDYTYLKKVSSNNRYNFYVGPQMNGLGWKVNYFPEMQVPLYGQVNSYMAAFSLGAAGYFQYKINSKSHLKLLVTTPVLSYADRPNFLDGSPRETKLSVFRLRNPMIQLTYEYAVSEKVALYVRYEYQYIQYPQPKALRMLNNSLSLGIKLNL